MFGVFIKELRVPFMKQLFIYSPSYRAEIHLVSRTIGGYCLRSPRGEADAPLEDGLYLVGAFIGIELSPRFLMLRKNSDLYNSLSDYDQGICNITYSDSRFEWIPMNTYWKIWREEYDD